MIIIIEINLYNYDIENKLRYNMLLINKINKLII